MGTPIFKGSGVALVTPFKNGEIDFAGFDRLVEYHVENGTDSIIVCGTTGESAAMNDKEHIACIEYVVKRVNGRIPVIAGAGSNDTRHGVALCKEAENCGADGLLLVTPYYNKATQKGLIKHYEMHADAVNIPIILYNVPSRTGVNIAVDTVYELSKHKNIVGIKEASGNISTVAQIAAKCGDDFAIYSGNDDMIVPILSLGGVGVISVVANIAPQQTHDLCEEYFKGNVEASRKLQLGMIELCDALFCEVNPIPVKTAMNILGFDMGELRMPLCEMAEKNEAYLKQALKNYGLLK